MPDAPVTKPDGWQKLRRHDDPTGSPEVGHDSARRRNYTVARDGTLLYDGVPDEVRWEQGRPVPKDAARATSDPPIVILPPPPQVVGTATQPSSIPASAFPEGTTASVAATGAGELPGVAIPSEPKKPAAGGES